MRTGVVVSGNDASVSDEEILAVLSQGDEPVVATGEVADELGLSSKLEARTRLKALEANDLAASKRIGNATAWWLTDKGLVRLFDSRDQEEAP